MSVYLCITQVREKSLDNKKERKTLIFTEGFPIAESCYFNSIQHLQENFVFQIGLEA